MSRSSRIQLQVAFQSFTCHYGHHICRYSFSKLDNVYGTRLYLRINLYQPIPFLLLLNCPTKFEATYRSAIIVYNVILIIESANIVSYIVDENHVCQIMTRSRRFYNTTHLRGSKNVDTNFLARLQWKHTSRCSINCRS